MPIRFGRSIDPTYPPTSHMDETVMPSVSPSVSARALGALWSKARALSWLHDLELQDVDASVQRYSERRLSRLWQVVGDEMPKGKTVLSFGFKGWMFGCWAWEVKSFLTLWWPLLGWPQTRRLHLTASTKHVSSTLCSATTGNTTAWSQIFGK